MVADNTNQYPIDQRDIETLKGFIDQANVITFYGGAGVSTESGLNDYRSKHGRWTQLKKERNENPIYFANIRRLTEDPVAFYSRRRNRQETVIEPNATHKILAEWEKNGRDVRVITQNVDGLHQKAGHRFVLELHGNPRTWFCNNCGRIYQSGELDYDQDGVPHCYVCQGIIRPNVVYFGENTDATTIKKSQRTLKVSDLLIIAGTSLTTPLAKRLIQEFRGDHIVVINHEQLEISPLEADLYIKASIGEVFTRVKALEVNVQ